MSLDLILLGTLRSPASGYDLKLWFERVFRHFWAAEPSQIYRTLGTLEAHGLLSVREEASTKGPAKRVYTTTARGRTAVRAWLRDGPSLSDERQSHVAQILFLAELPTVSDRIEYLAKLRAQIAARRDELEVVLARGGGHGPHGEDGNAESGDEFFRELTVDLGIHQYTAMLAWVDRTIERVRRRGDRTVKPPTREELT